MRAGEYAAVARYYDRMAEIDAVGRRHLTESAQAIRAGRMPERYQVAIEREAGALKK